MRPGDAGSPPTRLLWGEGEAAPGQSCIKDPGDGVKGENLDLELQRCQGARLWWYRLLAGAGVDVRPLGGEKS